MSQNKSPRVDWWGLDAPLLTWTNDMEAFSFSIPAGLTCPMMKAESKNDICSLCYAFINRYHFSKNIKVQLIRYWWTQDRLEDGTFVAEVSRVIKEFVGEGYFRGHDSGDFFSIAYTEAWTEICRQSPKTTFWFPFRGYYKGSPGWLKAHKDLAALKNVSLRPSALQIDQPAPVVEGFAPGSTVVSTVEVAEEIGCFMCPKSRDNTSCVKAGCRQCWDKYGEPVAYWLHSHMGMHMQKEVDFDKVVMRFNNNVQELLDVAQANGLPLQRRRALEAELAGFERRVQVVTLTLPGDLGEASLPVL